MTYFPPKNGKLPVHPEWVPKAEFEAAHRNFVIGYADVALRDPATGRFFFPTRNIEPEKGSTWLIGGRMLPGESTQEGAARHVLRDTKLPIIPGRFVDVSDFGIAHVIELPDQEPQGRHAKNTVLVANLKPDEVGALDTLVSERGLSKEYDGGRWYDPETDDRDELPDPLKQFLRDYFDRQVMITGLHAMAREDDRHRSLTSHQPGSQ